MKTISLVFTVIFFSPLLTHGNTKKDTITINFGNNSQIIILVNSQSDLKQLQEYDLNKMLKELQMTIDSANADIAYLKIEDEKGTKYLKDTTVILDYAEDFQFKNQEFEKEIEVSGFNSIEIGSNFEALIRRNDSYKVLLGGRQEDVEDVVATLDGNTLELEYKNLKTRRNRVKVYIEMPELNDLEVSGAAIVNAAGFESANFVADVSGAAKFKGILVAEEAQIDASGASRVKLIGKGNLLIADASGASEIDATEFDVQTASADASGAAKIRVNADELNSNSSGAGKIYSQGHTKENVNTQTRSHQANNYIRIKIGKYEFSVPTEGWEDFEDEFDDVETLEDVKEKVNTTEYIQETTPSVRHLINFDFGLNNYVKESSSPEIEGAPYSVKPWGSWYIGASSLHKFHVGGPLFLDWGKGISWYNFKFDNPDVRVLKLEQGVGFEEDSRNFSGIKSKITASYINMSLVPLLDFSQGLRRVKTYSMEGINFTQYHKRGFRIGFGGYAGYRIGSHTKYVYKDDKRQREKERGSFYLNNWRYGVRGQVGYKGLDLFFNYDLSPLYVGSASPKLHPISFGITF